MVQSAHRFDLVATEEREALVAVARRVLWLSSAMVDHANRVRPASGGVKVGGHQASCASMVEIMTSLWLRHLGPDDRVSVKPHAAPVLHALNHLLGRLDATYLPRLRELGGLQSYPSRSKDPDPVDYSTGSVGIGATAPVWGAVTSRYLASHGRSASGGRQYSLLGDAELDEGACWEAIVDPQVAELGEVCWVVDLNRQSLDRVVPVLAVSRLERMFASAGWQVLTVKYGELLESLFTRPGGDALRRRIDGMENPEYQRLLRCDAAALRERLPGEGEGATEVARLVTDLADDELLAAIGNLGGHDLTALDRAFAAVDDTRPTVVLAYTVKGHGLPTQGHPQNHSALLDEQQMRLLAEDCGTDLDDPWRPLPDDDPAAALLRAAAARLERPPVPEATRPDVPADLGHTPKGTGTTQAALGRALLDLHRQAAAVASRVVTVSPDVSSSTNLGGWINKVGVWSPTQRRDWFADDSETLLHWRETPHGQHLELGIAETNLVGLISELGLAGSRWGEPLLPVGVLYDPFVGRALEPWSFGVYAGGHSILVGTPSGVSLAGEGGAHQSVTTPSIGIEQPGVVAYEPAFAVEVEWCLLDGFARLGAQVPSSTYLRLSTRAVDQSLAAVPDDAAARERRRRQVLAGGYLLHADPDPHVTLVGMGACVPQVLDASRRLADLGVGADVVVVTSPDALHRAWRGVGPRWGLDQALPVARARPVVTVADAHPHALSWLPAVHRTPGVALGVTDFGQSGSLPDVHRLHGIDADAVTSAALDLVHAAP